MFTSLSQVKLGKQRAKSDPRTLRYAAYRRPRATLIPDACDWTPAVHRPGFLQWIWPMLANDKYGDCTCAAMAHMIECWTANTDNEFCPGEDQTLAAYAAITGFKWNDPSTDNGAAELDVLNFWRQTGIAGHQIVAYMTLEPHSLGELREAIYEFGGAYLGIALPLSAQAQDVWDVDPNAGDDGAFGSWGGHAVNLVAYHAQADLYTCITWGQPKKITGRFMQMYCDEAYAVLSQDWLTAAGETPSGFDLAALQADLQQVTAGTAVPPTEICTPEHRLCVDQLSPNACRQASNPPGGHCTREAGHSGPHIDCSGGHNFMHWPQTPTAPAA